MISSFKNSAKNSAQLFACLIVLPNDKEAYTKMTSTTPMAQVLFTSPLFQVSHIRTAKTLLSTEYSISGIDNPQNDVRS